MANSCLSLSKLAGGLLALSLAQAAMGAEGCPLLGVVDDQRLFAGIAREQPRDFHRLVRLASEAGEGETREQTFYLPNYVTGAWPGMYRPWPVAFRWRMGHGCLWAIGTHPVVLEAPEFALFRLPIARLDALATPPKDHLMALNGAADLDWGPARREEKTEEPARFVTGGLGYEWVSKKVLPLEETQLPGGYYDLWPTSPTSCIVALNTWPSTRYAERRYHLLPLFGGQTMIIAEYAFASQLERGQPHWVGKWRVLAEIPVDQVGPFRLIVGEHEYYWVTEKGNLYAANRDQPKPEARLVRDGREWPIRAVVIDGARDQAFACAIADQDASRVACFEIRRDLKVTELSTDRCKDLSTDKSVASLRKCYEVLQEAKLLPAAREKQPAGEAK